MPHVLCRHDPSYYSPRMDKAILICTKYRFVKNSKKHNAAIQSAPSTVLSGIINNIWKHSMHTSSSHKFNLGWLPSLSVFSLPLSRYMIQIVIRIQQVGERSAKVWRRMPERAHVCLSCTELRLDSYVANKVWQHDVAEIFCSLWCGHRAFRI